MLFKQSKSGAFYGTLFVVVAVVAIPAIANEFHLQQEYEAAFNLSTSGAAYDAAVRLIDLLRKCPEDDLTYAEKHVGPSQLLGFIVASLMDWPERSSLEHHVLKPEKYPSDRLLIAIMKAGSGIQSMASSAYGHLWQISKGDNVPAKIVALSIIASPYYYPKRYLRESATAELALRYPELSVNRLNAEGAVFKTLRLAKEQSKRNVNLLEDVVYSGGRKDRLVSLSPGLRIASEYLPSMNVNGITDTVVSNWANALLQEKDPETRYTLLCLLEYVERNDARRASMRPVLQALVKPVPQTIDQLRARLLLAEIDRGEHRAKPLRKHIEYFVPKGILPTTPERSLYEDSLIGADKTAGYFLRHGYHDDAVRIHNNFAAQFPNTTLSEKKRYIVQEIQADPLKAMLDAIEREVRPIRREKGDAIVETIYNEIIAHTENAALKNVLKNKVNALKEKAK